MATDRPSAAAILAASSSSSSLHNDAEASAADGLDTSESADPAYLRKVISELRTALRLKTASLINVEQQLDQVRASHEELLHKSANWKDELESLRPRVEQLQQQLEGEVQARQEEEDKVKDLRLRAEESRRAFMRLQGEQQDSARKAAKAENRRSWNPASAGLLPPGGAVPGNGHGNVEDEEAAALRKSKRASLAFGPNGTISAGTIRSAGGHRRTESGGKMPFLADDELFASANANGSALPTSTSTGSTTSAAGGPPSARGLKGLSLLGGTAPSEAASTDKSSRRTSMLSSNASPHSALSDLPAINMDDGNATIGRRHSPPATAAQTRNARNAASMRLSGIGVQNGNGSSDGLALFAQHSAQSAHSPGASSAALSSVGSPILEGREGEMDDGDELQRQQQQGLAMSPPRTARREEFGGGAALPTSASASGAGVSTLTVMRLEAQLQAKNAEVERLRLEMNGLRHDVDEAKEARMASEMCLKVLREFISKSDEVSASPSNHAGGTWDASGLAPALDLKGVKLPPLPTDADTDAEAEEWNASSSSRAALANGNGTATGEAAGAGAAAGTWGIRLSTLPSMMRKTTTGESGASARSGGSNSSVSGHSQASYTTSPEEEAAAESNTGDASLNTSFDHQAEDDDGKPTPVAPNASSFSNLWSRTVSSVQGARDSVAAAAQNAMMPTGPGTATPTPASGSNFTSEQADGSATTTTNHNINHRHSQDNASVAGSSNVTSPSVTTPPRVSSMSFSSPVANNALKNFSDWFNRKPSASGSDGVAGGDSLPSPTSLERSTAPAPIAIHMAPEAKGELPETPRTAMPPQSSSGAGAVETGEAVKTPTAARAPTSTTQESQSSVDGLSSPARGVALSRLLGGAGGNASSS